MRQCEPEALIWRLRRSTAVSSTVRSILLNGAIPLHLEGEHAITRTLLLRRRLPLASTRKLSVAVPAELAAQGETLVQQAIVLEFDVAVDQQVVGAYARLGERLKAELGDAAPNADDRPTPANADANAA